MQSNARTRRLYRLASAMAVAFVAGSLLAGCATQSPAPDDAADAAPAEAATPTSSAESSTMVATTFGKGTYSDGDRSTVSFMYDAELDGAGRSKGFFRHQGTYGDGRIDLAGDVTCVGFDHPEGRAWVAGIVTSNDSTVDFANADTLPVNGVVGFVVEDASVALTAHIQFPQPLKGKADKAARKFCDKRAWPSDGLYLLTAGTLGVFP